MQQQQVEGVGVGPGGAAVVAGKAAAPAVNEVTGRILARQNLDDVKSAVGEFKPGFQKLVADRIASLVPEKMGELSRDEIRAHARETLAEHGFDLQDAVRPKAATEAGDIDETTFKKDQGRKRRPPTTRGAKRPTRAPQPGEKPKGQEPAKTREAFDARKRARFLEAASRTFGGE